MGNTLENKKKCIRCGVEKTENYFYKTKDVLLKHCKECHKRGVTKSFKKNPANKLRKNTQSLKRYHDIISNNKPTVDITGRWRDVKGYEGVYQVSMDGEIRRWKKERDRWKTLKPYCDRNGYLKVNLTVNYKSNHQLVHRVVAFAFLQKDYKRPEVNHIDGNKKNNKVENLEWCNRSENMKHAHLIGLRKGITKRKENGQIDKGNTP